MNRADLWLRLRALIFRKRVERDLHREVGFHIEMAIRKNVLLGMSPEQARRQALIKFGSTANVTEECRDQRRVNFIDELIQDVRYACRQYCRAPGLVAVVVLSLAFGIGANTAIFSVMDALMLRKLPVRNPEQLASVGSGDIPLGAFGQMRERQSAFSDMSAIYRADCFLDGAQVRVGVVSGTYFAALGVDAIVGRTFNADEDRVRGGHPVAVISHGYWQRRYALVPDIVGRTFSLNGTSYTVIGVTPPEFSGDEIGTPTDLWVPMAMLAQVMVDRAALVADPDSVGVSIVVRLQPDVTMEQAEAQARTVYGQILMTGAAGQNAEAASLNLTSYAHGSSWQRQYYERPLEILMIVVGLVVLITCANVANLLLARSAVRQREMAVRLALGAGRMRILRQVFTESVLLSAFAGACGFIVAIVGTNVVASLIGAGPWAVHLDLNPDRRVLAFTAVLSVLTGILFGLAPAVRAAGTSPLRASNANTADRSSRTRTQRLGLGRMLVVSQVVLSIFLLIGAGLFIRTFRNLKFQDLGFDRERILMISTDTRQINLPSPAVFQLARVVQEEIESLPGVVSASPSSFGLLDRRGGCFGGFTVDGYTPKPNEDASACWNDVAPGYFQTLGMRLSAGRDFTSSDIPGAPNVAIINEALALHYFGRQDPIGRRVGAQRRTEGNEIEIVGMVKDAKYSAVREASEKMIYFPYAQYRANLRLNMAVRTDESAPDLTARIEEILRRVSPNLPVLSIESMDRRLDQALMRERLIAILSGFFSMLAVLLACVGLYGVISYTVARRTSEIGIRLALGATRDNVLGMVLKESMALVLIGIIIGVSASLAAARLVSSQLFGVSPTDPLTIGGVIVFMIAVAGLSGYLPARRAAKVDPMTALRYE